MMCKIVGLPKFMWQNINNSTNNQTFSAIINYIDYV